MTTFILESFIYLKASTIEPTLPVSTGKLQIHLYHIRFVYFFSKLLSMCSKSVRYSCTRWKFSWVVSLAQVAFLIVLL